LLPGWSNGEDRGSIGEHPVLGCMFSRRSQAQAGFARF
jgi:hypothetical protein